MNNYCVTCKTTEHLSVYARTVLKSGEKKAYYMCTRCNTERHRKWTSTPNGREKTRYATLRDRNRIDRKEKISARTAVRSITQLPCLICGSLPTHKHHPEPNQPYYIVFLCPRHHKRIHNGLMD